LLNRYPQGHPTILMRTLFGKRLQVDALPSRFNRLMVDAVTPWALGRYLRTKQTYVDRPIQVFVQESCADGSPCARLLVGRIGEAIGEFAKRYHVALDDREIILNGMLAGTLATPEAKIEGHTESISVRVPAAPEKATPCLACGWCVDVCPTALVPVRLLELNDRIPSGLAAILAPAPVIPPTGMPPGPVTNLLKSSTAREALHCIGCGLCSYVCPTRLPLAQETLALRLRVLNATGPRPNAMTGESTSAAQWGKA